jgi:protein SCO1/2
MAARRVYIYLIAIITIVLIGLGLNILSHQYLSNVRGENEVSVKSQSIGEADIGGAYSLVNQNGKVVTEKTYRGKYTIIFFGYTFCPDVCPTTLTTLSKVINLLGNNGLMVKPIFITVDPSRDSPKHLKSYLINFHKNFDGLTGNVKQIEHVKNIFHIFAEKSQEDNNKTKNYLVDHSSVSYLMGPDGRFLSFFSYGTEAEVIVNQLKKYF